MVGDLVRAKWVALVAGVIFGVGLCLAGMTDPKNVIGFLDIGGHWLPNLAFVMAGAILVHASFLRWGTEPKTAHSLAPRAPINRALVGGAALFGIGWGLSGYCPGPSVVALGSGALAPIVFVGCTLLGMRAVDALSSPLR